MAAGHVPVWVSASANQAKVDEMRAILAGDAELLPRPDDVADVVEDADTLEGNARLKANAIRDATGHTAIADDTGLIVDALDGGPGVYSARYAGPGCSDADNRVKLLAELGNRTDRGARFRTVIVVAFADGTELVAEGVCDGQIARRERGEGGFGYDAVFVPDEGEGRTFAEMPAADKHNLSHRGRALRALVTALAHREKPR